MKRTSPMSGSLGLFVALSLLISTSAFADVSIAVTAVPANGSVDFVVTTTNRGPAAATNVAARLQVDGANPFLTAVPPNCTQLGGEVTCVAATLAAGESASYTVTVFNGGALTGTARVGTGNNTAVATAAIAGPQLSITVTPAEATLSIGSTASHTITVSNDDTAATDSLAIVEDWSGGVKLLSATPSSGNCTISSGAHGLTCNLAGLAAGAKATVTVVATATTTGTWAGSVQAYVPLSGFYPVGGTYVVTVVPGALHRRAARH